MAMRVTASVVFAKREAFQKAFRGFDVAKVATMTARDVDRLVQDASIIRNRAKIQATVDNARAMMSASPSLVDLAQSFETTRKRAPRSLADTQVDRAGGGVREAVEAARVPLRGTFPRRAPGPVTVKGARSGAQTRSNRVVEPNPTDLRPCVLLVRRFGLRMAGAVRQSTRG